MSDPLHLEILGDEVDRNRPPPGPGTHARAPGPRRPAMGETALCRSCGAAIRWATMASGKLNPLDADPVPDGNIAAHLDDKGDLHARALKIGEDPEPHERLGTSHFATCPRADEHRRRG